METVEPPYPKYSTMTSLKPKDGKHMLRPSPAALDASLNDLKVTSKLFFSVFLVNYFF